MSKYGSNFWRLCMSMFFFMTSFNLILPEMNTFATHFGGAEYKGFLIALFTISAGLSRPFSGKLADYIGRKKVIFTGIAVCFLVSTCYSFTVSLSMLLVLRFLHGFSAGFLPTGATALVTDILPEKLRGTGMGIWGTFISLGIGVGQGLSTTCVEAFGQNGLFFISSLTVCFSFILSLSLKETLVNPVKFKWEFLKIKSTDIVERSVLPVAIVMFLSAMCSGIIFVLSPDISAHLKMENKGAFFVFYVMSTILIRLSTGKISDKIGRRQMLLIGMIILTASMVLIGLSTTQNWYIGASILFGVATGVSSPTIFAWTADLSPNNRRGVGAGTMFIALEFGILSGALLTNVLYQNNPDNFLIVFLFGAAMSGITVIYLIWHLVKFRSKY